MNYMGIKIRFEKGIVYVTAPNQYILCDVFMRMQEFYESPIEEIRGNYFSVEKFQDEYAKKFSKFDYHTAWSGFNIPSDVVKRFYHKFFDLSTKELHLKNLLKIHLRSRKKFYVIGTIEGEADGTLDHEIAHAKYYLKRSYHRSMNRIIRFMPKYMRNYLIESLIQMKYDRSVARDEIQAYLSTTLDFLYLTKNFRVKEMSWVKNKIIHLLTLPYLFKLRRIYKDSK